MGYHWMNTFWKLYKKEFRFLLGPGIGLILYTNAGWIVLFLKYLSPSSYYRFSEHVNFLPRFGNLSVSFVAIPATLVFLYSLLYEHIAKKRHQGFSFPIRRSIPIISKFASVMTWAYASVPLMLMLHTVHRWFGYPDPLLLNGYSNVYGSHALDIAIELCSIVIAGIAFCAPIMFGYAVALSIRRLQVAVGLIAIIAGYVALFNMGSYIMQHSLELFFMEDWTIPKIILTLGSVMVTGITILVPALLLYERYAEV